MSTMPQRAIRVPDEMWQAAVESAGRDERSVSQLIRKLLAEHLEKDQKPPG